MVDFESTLERDLAVLLEFDEDVASYDAQPLKVPFNRGGRSVEGTPDFLIAYRPELGRAPLLCDVKYRAEIFESWTDLKPRLLAALRYARTKGWQYRILTEVEIRGPYLDNVRFLLPYRRIAVDAQIASSIIETLQTHSVASVSKLLNLCSLSEQRSLYLSQLWCLAAQRSIHADLQRPLTMETMFRVGAT